MRRSPAGAFVFIGKLFSMLRAIAGARVVVLDAYCMAVSIPKKRLGQTVVQLWHAPEAIKKFSLQIVDTSAGYDSKTAETLCMHRNYDYILCPADATRPFFSEAFGYPESAAVKSGYPESAFVKLGLPMLDRLGLMKKPAPGVPESPERVAARTLILERYPVLTKPHIIARSESDEAVHKDEMDCFGTASLAMTGGDISTGGWGRPLTVVYAPTFRDGASVDAEGLVRAFSEMDSAALVLKLHPLDIKATGIPDALTINQVVMNDAEFPLADWYSVADVVITDYSGVAVEAAAAGIASYYYIYDIDDYKARRGLNVDLRDEAVGKYAFTDADTLVRQVISDFAVGENGGDSAGNGRCSYDYEALAAFAGKYLEVPLFGNTERLAGFIAELGHYKKLIQYKR